MNLYSIYHKCVAGDEVHNKANSLSKAQQKQLADAFPAPKDDYERAYIKHMCRKYMDFDNGNFSWLILNTVSLMLFLPLWVICSINGMRIRPAREKNGAIILKSTGFANIDDILPTESLNRFGEYQVVSAGSVTKGLLHGEGHRILRMNIARHPFSFYMNLLLLLNLGKYESLIAKYQPRALFSYADERSPVNPLLTLLCEGQGIDHIGFMHGEVYFQLDKGFFRYTDYWVWDSFYKQLFREMYCSCPMHEYLPKKLMLSKMTEDVPDVFLTYYDAENSPESLAALADVFAEMENAGKKCILRPHPRFSNTEAISRLFKPEMIQDGKVVSIAQSFQKTKYVAAICSTVLMEAYYAGKDIVIDDLTDKARLAQIADKGYMMLSKEHTPLSVIVKNERK